MLVEVISENQRDWDVHVPAAVAAYRASEHAATGFSPNVMMFGREVPTPVYLVFGLLTVKVEQWISTTDFVTDVQERYRATYRLAGEQLRVHANHRKEVYDRKVVKIQFRSGQWVWYYYPRRYKGRSPKWFKTYVGPFLKVDVLSGTNVKIQRSENGAPPIVHVDKLKLCRGRTPKSWLMNLQSKELEIPSQEVLIDEVGDPPSEIEPMTAEYVPQDPQPKPNSPAEEEVEQDGDHSNIERSSRPERQLRTPAHLR